MEMPIQDKKMLERKAVQTVIQQWNTNRIDLFALSEPDENLLFHGVMRFYFQDAGQKVATKCIRVASDATVSDVIETLVEKFRPDMRMLSVPNYALYEVHANGEERRLNPDEKPLLVQLNWHIDDREGRFLLRNIDQKTTTIESTDNNFKRKLSKREKKEQKKKEKLAKLNSESGSISGVGGGNNIGNGSNDANHVAEKLYTELPETSFTRSISNPEAVMRRRRQQKLEKKLQQFRSRDGGPDTGGTLKIYGESLCRDVPYKTLLLSIRDCAQAVVREMLTKYGLEKADPLHYCLVQVNSDGTEYILDDDECPLSILMNHPTSRGSIMFHVRRRPADSQPRRRKKKPLGVPNGTNNICEREGPMLVEVTHSGDGGRRIKLGSDPVEVGSANTNSLQLFGPSIQARHCLISLLEGVCTVTPLHTDALTFVNGHHITQPTILHNGSVVMFGRVSSYRFIDSPSDGRYNLALSQSQLDSACLYERNSKISMAEMQQGQEPILPAVLEFPETHQENFLRQVITELDVNAPNFKLSPVYTLYLCARYRASTHYRPELQPTERAHKLTIFLHHVANLIYSIIQDQYNDPRVLAFWMANSSEFLHFLKSDRHISAFSVQAQEVLAESVQSAFRNLVNCFRVELSQTLNQFLSENIDHESAAGFVLTVLGSAMALLRRCRVNAALTIQLFSQLFHYINVICFNTIVANSHMCTAEWGKVMLERLQLLELWAERQGLELAADCHLAKINQCAQFLQAPKTTVEEIQKLACSCFRLNSLQMAALLQQEQIPRNLIDTAIRMAESVADELTRADGREVRLEESPELHLALLLPDDGFSCDVVRGIPSGLVDFLNPLQAAGMCRLAAQPTSIGLWTVYMHQFNTRSPSSMSNKLPQPEVQVIKLHKNSNGMGLSIVAAKGAGQERLGIYIKSVVPGGAADADGRLQAGDQLLRVDGQSLIGITQERAADYLVRTGPIVTLEVAKQGAIYHGLATLLQQPSPVIQRDSDDIIPVIPPYPTNLNYGSGSDESIHSVAGINTARYETFPIIYSNYPHRRRSSSSLQEELCARGEKLHIDPRYRDTRPIARSSSSLILAAEYNSPLRSNWDVGPAPSIFIEQYNDDAVTTQSDNLSNESLTQLNITQIEAHQPLNEDSLASCSGEKLDQIPFIDDGTPPEEEKPYVPPDSKEFFRRSRSSISSVASAGGGGIIKEARSNSGCRKTVSFDLIDDKLNSTSFDGENTKFSKKSYTFDTISTIKPMSGDNNCNIKKSENLDQKDDVEKEKKNVLKSYKSNTYSIEQFDDLDLDLSELKSTSSSSRSSCIGSKDIENGTRNSDIKLAKYNKNKNSKKCSKIFKFKVPLRKSNSSFEVRSFMSNSNSDKTPILESFEKKTTNKEVNRTEILDVPDVDDLIPQFGQGKVKVITEFFEFGAPKGFLEYRAKSRSNPELNFLNTENTERDDYRNKNIYLKQNEVRQYQDKPCNLSKDEKERILNQLKEWSLYGTKGKENYNEDNFIIDKQIKFHEKCENFDKVNYEEISNNHYDKSPHCHKHYHHRHHHHHNHRNELIFLAADTSETEIVEKSKRIDDKYCHDHQHDHLFQKSHYISFVDPLEQIDKTFINNSKKIEDQHVPGNNKNACNFWSSEPNLIENDECDFSNINFFLNTKSNHHNIHNDPNNVCLTYKGNSEKSNNITLTNITDSNSDRDKMQDEQIILKNINNNENNLQCKIDNFVSNSNLSVCKFCDNYYYKKFNPNNENNSLSNTICLHKCPLCSSISNNNTLMLNSPSNISSSAISDSQLCYKSYPNLMSSSLYSSCNFASNNNSDNNNSNNVNGSEIDYSDDKNKITPRIVKESQDHTNLCEVQNITIDEYETCTVNFHHCINLPTLPNKSLKSPTLTSRPKNFMTVRKLKIKNIIQQQKQQQYQQQNSSSNSNSNKLNDIIYNKCTQLSNYSPANANSSNSLNINKSNINKSTTITKIITPITPMLFNKDFKSNNSEYIRLAKNTISPIIRCIIDNKNNCTRNYSHIFKKYSSMNPTIEKCCCELNTKGSSSSSLDYQSTNDKITSDDVVEPR